MKSTHLLQRMFAFLRGMLELLLPAVQGIRPTFGLSNTKIYKTPNQKLLHSDEEFHLHLKVAEELNSVVFPEFTSTPIYQSKLRVKSSEFNVSILFLGVNKYH